MANVCTFLGRRAPLFPASRSSMCGPKGATQAQSSWVVWRCRTARQLRNLLRRRSGSGVRAGSTAGALRHCSPPKGPECGDPGCSGRRRVGDDRCTAGRMRQVACGWCAHRAAVLGLRVSDPERVGRQPYLRGLSLEGRRLDTRPARPSERSQPRSYSATGRRSHR